MSKRAVILAGGKGTRLRPYTLTLPKPLVPVGDLPILEIVIRKLAVCGFDHITLTVNHQAEIIKAFFGDGSKWNIHIDYSYEDKPLSTMGPLSLIDDLPDNFLVMNGDILSNINYGGLYDFHVKHQHSFTVSSYVREHVNLYGVLEANENNQLVGFKEKPTSSFLVSMGVYMLNKSVLQYIPKNEAFGFDHLMLAMIKAGDAPSVKRFNGYWLDIGRPDDYAKATEVFQENPNRFLDV